MMELQIHGVTKLGRVAESPSKKSSRSGRFALIAIPGTGPLQKLLLRIAE